MKRIAKKHFLDGSHWIYECPTCLALFSSKAIPGRSIFPWFGYHPNDGNDKIISEDLIRLIELRVRSCKCPERVKRINSQERLLAVLGTYEVAV